MAKTPGGPAIGFVVSGCLGSHVFVVALALLGELESDSVQYAPLIFGAPASLLRGVMGVAIGIVVGGRLEG
jgi:hypothetical protein